LGDREEALASTQEAVKIYRQLAAQRPEAFLPDLARSLNNLGNSQSDLGDREGALASTQEAVKIYRQLAAQRPEAFLPDLARSLGVLGRVHFARSEHTEATAAVKEGARLLFPLFSRYPGGLQALMVALLKDYVSYAQESEEDLDEDLVGKIRARLEELGTEAPEPSEETQE
jgi:tetratricopeptide (TPR) repeat protein